MRWTMRRVIGTAATVFLAAGSGFAADLDDPVGRIPARSLAEAEAAIDVADGFRVELAAAEPEVVDPVAIAFGAGGEMYAVEMRGYSERRDEMLGTVRRLRDDDGDGRFETATVFADGLMWPTGIACWGGGVFVLASPDLWFCRDTDGDGAADIARVVLTGFGVSADRLNVQALPNSLTWGIDNRIYGATSMNGAELRRPGEDVPLAALTLRGRDFSFDPRALLAGEPGAVRAESGGGQYGLTIDDFGRRFVCSNSHHLQYLAVDERYRSLAAGPSFPNPLLDIAADGPAAEVFRRSPDEPWRIVRTRWRVEGLASGPIEGGGRVSGYFTAATGITAYRGDLFPPDFRGDIIVCDAGSNLVHRKTLIRDPLRAGDPVIPIAARPNPDEQREFLASADNWFRPVQCANGPDGALYVVDMCREVIEHPWSLPEPIKAQLDLNAGNDRGRIWRVVPEDADAAAAWGNALQFSDATSVGDLVRALGSPNGWTRDTASRLIFERQDAAAIAGLRELARAGDAAATAVIHALYGLDGLGALTIDDVSAALRRPAPAVQVHALRLAEAAAEDGWTGDLRDAVMAVTDDAAAAVRFQAALTLSAAPLEAERQARAVAGILRETPDPWMTAAAARAIAAGGPAAADALLADVAEGAASGAALAIALPFASSAGTAEALGRLEDTLQRHGVLASIAEAGTDAIKSVRAAVPTDRRETWTNDAAAAAIEPTAPADERAAAMTALGVVGGRTQILKTVEDVLAPDPAIAPEIRRAAIDTLRRAIQVGTIDPDAAADAVIAPWPRLTNEDRARAAAIALTGAAAANRFLNAVGNDQISAETVPDDVRAALRRHPNVDIARAAAAAFADADTAETSRAAALEAARPALETDGDPARGRDIFFARCASCHRIGGEGFALGPDAEAFRASGRDAILTNLIDPSREVAPAFQPWMVRQNDGSLAVGLIASESERALTLRGPFGQETEIPRPSIAERISLGASIMPAGLEAGLTHRDLASLLAFLTGETSEGN